VSAKVDCEIDKPGRGQGDLDDHRWSPVSPGLVYGILAYTWSLLGVGGRQVAGTAILLPDDWRAG